MRCLQLCDVVLYDRLVSREIVSMTRADALLIDVGKQAGEHQQTQEQILELIRTHTLAGKIVARLKGGDPIVFGRGAEEWAFAIELGIPVEFIPGISSAIAVPALAGIPLTYRELSRSFAVITGHSHSGELETWKHYAGIDTLVILMGVQNRASIAQELIGAGRRPEEPAAFVQRGTLPDQVVTETTLGEVAASRVVVHSPAVFVVGQVVKLRERLQHQRANV